MKKIILYILTTLALLGLLYKIIHPNEEWNTEDFIEYMSEVPTLELNDTISTIQSDWGIWNFAKVFFNTIITISNFAIKIIKNIVNVIINILYILGYFFNIIDYYDNQNTENGGGYGPSWRGGR